jgi:hypothetical protein
MSFSEFKSNYQGDISIPYYGVTYTGKMNEKKYNRNQKILNSKLDKEDILNHQKDIFILSTSESKIDAWTKCMNDYPGKFESIVRPIDEKNGIYSYTYHYTFYPKTEPKFKGFDAGENLIIVDKQNYLQNGSKIRPSVNSIVRLKLKDTRKSGTLIVFSDLGDQSFFIPAIKEIPSPPDLYLSKRLETSYSPADRYIIYDAAGKNKNKIEIDGKSYGKGVYMHPSNKNFYVNFQIPEYFKYFNFVFGQAKYGSNPEKITGFQGIVFIDEEEVKRIRIDANNRSVPISVKIPPGAQKLTLHINPLGDSKSDHCTWADAHFSVKKKY